jgi:hypothetical protein
LTHQLTNMAKNDNKNGRGAVAEEPEKVQIAVELPADVYAKIAAAAAEGERSNAAQLRMIAKQWAAEQDAA